MKLNCMASCVYVYIKFWSNLTIYIVKKQIYKYCFDKDIIQPSKVLEMLNNNSSKLKRPLDLLYEHKIMMNSRIEYMNQNGYISNEDYIALSEKCEKLIYKTLLARNLWIKYSMTIGNTNSSELLKKIYNYVLESKNMDKEFTKYLMSCIRSPKSGN